VEDSALSPDGKESVEVSPPAAAELPPSGAAALAVARDEAALERERWLRDRFEKEHQVTLAMMRLLVAGVRKEGQCMRFWRWLIDDLRSERRLLEEPDNDSWDEAVLLRRVRAWFSRRGTGNTGDAGGAGLSERSA
jgi:hypothetical protein